MPAEQLYFGSVGGPYQQETAVKTKDLGNRLPIHVSCYNGDPHSATSNSMTISTARSFHKMLGEAIDAAEAAGLQDGGPT